MTDWQPLERAVIDRHAEYAVAPDFGGMNSLILSGRLLEQLDVAAHPNTYIAKLDPVPHRIKTWRFPIPFARTRLVLRHFFRDAFKYHDYNMYSLY